VIGFFAGCKFVIELFVSRFVSNVEQAHAPSITWGWVLQSCFC
jgi:hypothetical protein